jgi:uncharacterized protein (TIGR03067 family)
MNHRTRSIVVIAVWIAPVFLGIAGATWLIAPSSPRGMRSGLAAASDRDDRHRLQGTWEGIRVERDGKPVYQGAAAGQAKVRFVGDAVTFEDQGARLGGTFVVDQHRTPKTFDLTVIEAGLSVTYPAGIYQLSGDTFRLCVAFPSATRPTSFETSPGSGRTLFIYRRTRPEQHSIFDERPGHHARGMTVRPAPLPRFAVLRPGGTMRLQLAIPLIAALLPGPSPAAEPAKKTWDFEADDPGKIANEVGQWEVARDGDNHVLYQKAKNEDAVFNVALVEGTSYKDLDLSVKLRAVAGDLDRGGDVVWRARDKRNYYIARYNPLEDNFRVYKVQDGKRTQFASAKVAGDEKWHSLRVTMMGAKITCYLDGQKHLEAEDTTFPEAGMIGLWSKADAQSYFDDLTVN